MLGRWFVFEFGAPWNHELAKQRILDEDVIERYYANILVLQAQ